MSSFESSPHSHHHSNSTAPNNNSRTLTRKVHPDPIRAPPLTTNATISQSHSSKLVGYGPHRSYRHLHHQRGIIGTFHVRLLEGRNLQRKHWSALSLGPVKHLGLSRAHGEVSSFGTLRLAFWNNENDDSGGCGDENQDDVGDEEDDILQYCKEEPESRNEMRKEPPSPACESSSSSLPSSAVEFLPNLPPPPHSTPFAAGGSSAPLTPFNQGSLRSSTPARSPFVAAYSSQQKQSTPLQQQHHQQQQQQKITPRVKNFATSKGTPTGSRSNSSQATAAAAAAAANVVTTPPHPFPTLVPPSSKKTLPAGEDANNHSNPISNAVLLPRPHHYAKEEFKSSTVLNDSNPVWGDSQIVTNSSGKSTNNSHNANDGFNSNNSNFRIPLQKDDLFPTLQTDGGRIGLEIRLDEEMAPTESLLVGGALSSAINVASAATSVVGMGKQTKQVSDFGREILGLSSDRLIGRGYVDLMPLLVGLWEDDWDVSSTSDQQQHAGGSNQDKPSIEEEDADLDVYGRIPPNAHMTRRRMERMGLLNVWVPLHHPSDVTMSSSSSSEGKDKSKDFPGVGKVHLLISYEPYGMMPKRDDVVALESFARRPFDQVSVGGSGFGSNNGSVINPILPPLCPFLVIDIKGSYLLLQYATSRTVTSVDRLGNCKSSRWERTHRVRIHRNAVFVIERRTFLDVAGNIARLPGDIVLSTHIGQELAEATAPVVAGAMELMAPAFMSVKLLWGAGGLGVRAGLAGAKAATEAVVSASQQKAMERREGLYVNEREDSDSGVYRFG